MLICVIDLEMELCQLAMLKKHQENSAFTFFVLFLLLTSQKKQIFRKALPVWVKAIPSTFSLLFFTKFTCAGGKYYRGLLFEFSFLKKAMKKYKK